MPVRSKAQFRRFQAMHKRGEISKATLDKWLKGVDFKSLPTRVGKKKVRKTKKSRSKKTARKRQGRKKR